MELALIFPHQLFWPHPAVKKDRPVGLIEDPLFFGPDREWPTRMHRQKLMLHRASMEAFAERLRDHGVEVHYRRCPAAGGTTETLLTALVGQSIGTLHWVDPVDDVLSQRVSAFAQARGLKLVTSESPHFLTPAAARSEWFSGNRRPFMARFYEQQRRRMNLLMNANATPLGGKWSFDTENRRRLPKTVTPPAIARFPPGQRLLEIRREIDADFPDAVGLSEGFNHATTHSQAERQLDDFLENRFRHFGEFEDAISQSHATLFHSVLTPSLNLGLLTPDQIIARTMATAESHHVPLNSIEGFVRQIIGWREFMRIVYERDGRRMRTRNFWGFTRRMPRAFYEATTGIPPVDQVIRRLLQSGYCHHIERLMVLGNFMLLCRIHPDDVYRWFMEMFIDSYDWVMVPNVYGMSQFADGGSFTTKPYLSGSNYLLKMSDYPRGPWCEIWDGLFWTFIADHHEYFEKQPRLSMMAHTCAKLGPKLNLHRQTAERFLSQLQ